MFAPECSAMVVGTAVTVIAGEDGKRSSHLLESLANERTVLVILVFASSEALEQLVP